jgi:hypothetical protein
VLAGSLIGVSGLFLSVPAIAMLKIICDQVEGLEPWGMLLGDDITGSKKMRFSERLKVLKLTRNKKELKPPVI